MSVGRHKVSIQTCIKRTLVAELREMRLAALAQDEGEDRDIVRAEATGMVVLALRLGAFNDGPADALTDWIWDW